MAYIYVHLIFIFSFIIYLNTVYEANIYLSRFFQLCIFVYTAEVQKCTSAYRQHEEQQLI